MVETWGGPDVQNPSASQGNDITNTAPQPMLPGFDRFMMTRFSPLCWALPTNSNFTSKDAQARQVLGEVACLQKAIYQKTGQEYVTWLRDVELREMGMDGNIMEEYLRALCNFDLKGFRQFFQVCCLWIELRCFPTDINVDASAKEYSTVDKSSSLSGLRGWRCIPRAFGIDFLWVYS